MKEKVKRILDLIRAGKLTLDDAAPLLTALSSRLALIGSDQDLIRTLLHGIPAVPAIPASQIQHLFPAYVREQFLKLVPLSRAG